jgi:hypothetical protein
MEEQKLDQVFLKQDEILRENIGSSDCFSEAYALISDACYAALKVLKQLPFDEEKKHVIVAFVGDAISSAIVATRVGLWGDFPESMSALRPAGERAVQLLYVVGDNKYKTAKYEMQAEFKQVSYEVAVNAMGSFGKKSETLRGLISGVAAHASAKRFTWNTYEKDGADFLRSGFSRDRDVVLLALYYCADVPMLVLHAIQCAYDQESRENPGKAETDSLMERLTGLKKKMGLAMEAWKVSGTSK